MNLHKNSSEVRFFFKFIAENGVTNKIWTHLHRKDPAKISKSIFCDFDVQVTFCNMSFICKSSLFFLLRAPLYIIFWSYRVIIIKSRKKHTINLHILHTKISSMFYHCNSMYPIDVLCLLMFLIRIACATWTEK